MRFFVLTSVCKNIQIAVFFSLLYIGGAQDSTISDELSHNTNTIETSPSGRLDPYIRKALLKALSDLEESDSFINSDSTDSTSVTQTDRFDKSDEITKSGEENIKIHSFVVNGQAAFTNSSQATPMLIDSKISILSTTIGNVENYVTADLPTQAPFNEILQTKESVNSQQTRSIPSSSKSSTNLDYTSKSRGISTTTTTTTTPKPTHNEDGENIEEVDKKDVQVFQAPLVAAFTVHQDAQGIPKKVIPIYQQSNIQEILKPSPTISTPTNIIIPSLLSPAIPTINVPAREFLNQQLSLQKQLEEKQIILEQQLRLLQLQQKQHEELLRKQQQLLQEKEAQRLQEVIYQQEQKKRQNFIGEQQQLPSNQIYNKFNIHQNFAQNPVSGQNTLRQNSLVTIQPSVTLDQTNTVAPQQQLPNREAVDFLIHLKNQQSNQFPLQENHLPQGISSFLQPNSVHKFNTIQNFQLTNQVRLDDPLGQKQGNRVFRHESGVGNYGINNQNYNRFNSFEPSFPNRFTVTNRFNQLSRDIELKQLLAQTNINTRANEDLNIVSKVLSLNHGIQSM